MHPRPPKSLTSRKFIAQCSSSVMLKGTVMATLAGMVKFDRVDPWLAAILMLIIFVDGLRDFGYILSQASLDKVLATVGKATDAVAAVAKAKGPKP